MIYLEAMGNHLTVSGGHHEGSWCSGKITSATVQSMDLKGWNRIQPFLYLILPQHSVIISLSDTTASVPQRAPQSILISQLKMQNKPGHSPPHCPYKNVKILNSIRKSWRSQVRGSHPVSIPSLLPWVFPSQSRWASFRFFHRSKLLFPLVLELQMVSFP